MGTDTAVIRHYKTGDPHPTEKYLAFVEYCARGHEIWTSVFDDLDAPNRLVTKSGQYPPPCKCRSIRNEGSEAFLPRFARETGLQ